jgi:lipoprotein-releasing system ATP-binding protein
MIQVKNVSKYYDKLCVLDRVSLDILEGAFIAITGPSGAGKSTLLHIIGALDNANDGQVLINNKDILRLNAKAQAQFRNQHLGFVFQFHHLLPEFSAIENVAMPLWIKKSSPKEATKRAKELLETVGLADKINNKPSELSGGEQQRVAIARALANSPSILLADEPTGNLDSNNANHIHQLFKTLNDTLKQTIVLVTHNEELAAIAHQNVKMKDGRIIEKK